MGVGSRAPTRGMSPAAAEPGEQRQWSFSEPGEDWGPPAEWDEPLSVPPNLTYDDETGDS